MVWSNMYFYVLEMIRIKPDGSLFLTTHHILQSSPRSVIVRRQVAAFSKAVVVLTLSRAWSANSWDTTHRQKQTIKTQLLGVSVHRSITI